MRYYIARESDGIREYLNPKKRRWVWGIENGHAYSSEKRALNAMDKIYCPNMFLVKIGYDDTVTRKQP